MFLSAYSEVMYWKLKLSWLHSGEGSHYWDIGNCEIRANNVKKNFRILVKLLF